MTHSLEEIQLNLINEAKKGYPILLSGCIVFLLFTFLPFFFPMKTVYLIWIFGLGVIFPFGILISKLLGVNILTTGNALGTLGGIVPHHKLFISRSLLLFICIFQLIYLLQSVY